MDAAKDLSDASVPTRVGRGDGLRAGGGGTSLRGAEPDNPVTSAGEAPMSEIREITSAALGRSGKPVRFLRFTFHDGSELDVEHPDPAQLAETIHLNRR